MHLLAYSESSIIGGAEISLATLLSGLDDGIEVTVACTSAEVMETLLAARPSARGHLVGLVDGKWDIAGIASYLRLLRALRPDVLQANCGSPWECQFALLAGNLTPGVRTLAVHHTATPPKAGGQLRRNRINLRRTDAQVCVFTRGARTIEQWLRLREGAIRVIHNGVADRPVTPLARPAGGPIIGMVGHLHPRKGHDVMLQALPAIPGATVVILGEGPERARLERLARDLGVEARVLMPGWQADPRPWLHSFDVFAMPSRTEPQGLATIEAMLAARPVVATAVDGVAEVVVDGTTGILVPPDDPRALAGAVGSLLEDPDLRCRMGEAGQLRARQMFSVEKMARSYEAVYGELLEGGRKP